ncbi:MAG: M48 family metalloprotease [Proteobacteria bacterium]|nr:M48 family metalloprotease [Pseudomonadota bacterium]
MRARKPFRWPLAALLAALCLAALALTGCASAAGPGPAEPTAKSAGGASGGAGPQATPEARREAELQREFAAQTYYERLDRLNAVAWPLATAGEPLCRQRGRVHQSLGLVADSFNRRDNRRWFAALSGLWGVGEDTPVVIGVMPGGPAHLAGVRRGDVLRAAKGKPLDVSGNSADLTRRLDDLAAGGPVDLELVRAGKPLTLTIPAPKAICDTRFTVILGDAVNAYADGKNVFATYGAMNLFAKDEDLAVVLGHELAHNILGHVRQDASGKATGATTPQQEAEADAVGLYFTARAGFNIKDAPGVWRRLAAQNPTHISAGGDHPSTAARFLNLEAVRDEILMRQAAGLPLIPRPRVAPTQ